MLAMLAASTLYHASTSPRRRRRWRIADHASIYVLIAGSYTPLCLTSLRGIWGWSLLGTVWTMAIVGILLKLRFTGRYDRISTAMYLLMGWLCLVAAVPMVRLLQGTTLVALVFAGLAFTTGVWFYLRLIAGGSISGTGSCSGLQRTLRGDVSELSWRDDRSLDPSARGPDRQGVEQILGNSTPSRGTDDPRLTRAGF